MNVIPKITDPLGIGWRQPSTKRILIDERYAVMEPSTFNALAEYSNSVPTGVYAGKMWKGEFEHRWYLRWYVYSLDSPDECMVISREILICQP